MEIYEQAILSGQTAALLEQERPNIFTQTVGNIAPGEEIHIEISYIDVLDYDHFFGPKIKVFIDKYFNLLTVIFIILLAAGFIVIKYLA